jgi:hypothetical protein
MLSRCFWQRPQTCSPNVLALRLAFRYPGLRERGGMVQRVSTVAFEGIEARAVDVQVQVAPGLPAFAMVARQCQISRPFYGEVWVPYRTPDPILLDPGTPASNLLGLKGGRRRSHSS